MNQLNAHFSNEYFNSIFDVFRMFWTSWVHSQDGSKHVEDVKNWKIELKY